MDKFNCGQVGRLQFTDTAVIICAFQIIPHRKWNDALWTVFVIINSTVVIRGEFTSRSWISWNPALITRGQFLSCTIPDPCSFTCRITGPYPQTYGSGKNILSSSMSQSLLAKHLSIVFLFLIHSLPPNAV